MKVDNDDDDDDANDKLDKAKKSKNLNDESLSLKTEEEEDNDEEVEETEAADDGEKKDGKGEGSKKTPRAKKSAADDPRITRYRKLMKIAGLRIVTNKELDAMKSQKSKYDFMKQIFIDAGL